MKHRLLIIISGIALVIGLGYTFGYIMFCQYEGKKSENIMINAIYPNPRQCQF